jgi:hypothetical protein
MDSGSRGNRDVEVYYAELVIRVYDQDKWVADVNNQDIFYHRLSSIIPPCTTLHDRLVKKDDLSKYVAIDNWDELLDSPLEIGVVRARGNWQARLAAAALSIQQGHETRILGPNACWTCCVSRPPQPPAEDEDEDVDEDIDNAIPAADEYSDEENSDSDVDEKIDQNLRPSKRRKLQHGDSEYPKASRRRNIIYIM